MSSPEQPPTPQPMKKPEVKRPSLEEMDTTAEQWYQKAGDMNPIELERFAKGMAEIQRRKKVREQAPPPEQPSFPRRGHLRIIK